MDGKKESPCEKPPYADSSSHKLTTLHKLVGPAVLAAFAETSANQSPSFTGYSKPRNAKALRKKRKAERQNRRKGRQGR